MAKNKYCQNLKAMPKQFWDNLLSLEAYIGVVVSPTKTAHNAEELYKLAHFVYWVAPPTGMGFDESVSFLKTAIDQLPRETRRKYQSIAREKLKRGSARHVVFGSLEATGKEAFYKSWEWRTMRMKVLKESGFRCQCCGAAAKDTDMFGKPVRLCVDHIKPLSKYWHLRLASENLQVLCDECNQGKGNWDQTDHRPKLV